MKHAFIASASLLVLAACSSNPEPASTPAAPTPVTTTAVTPPPAATPPAARAFSALGLYDFTTVAQGSEVRGTIEIVRTETGSLGGKISTSMTPDLPIRAVTVDGRKLTIESDIPDAGPLTMVLNFEADNNTFAGNWSMSGDGGNMSGKRRVN
jgi:hypothetical protein